MKLTAVGSGNKQCGDEFAHYLRLASEIKRLAGGVKGSTNRRSCFRLKRALFQGGIDWHGRPRRSPATSWTHVRGSSSMILRRYASDDHWALRKSRCRSRLANSCPEAPACPRNSVASSCASPAAHAAHR